MIILTHDSFWNHVSVTPHPESPNRLDAAMAGARQAGVTVHSDEHLTRPATVKELCRVHHRSYVERLLATLSQTSGNLDPDTYFCADTKEAALRAAGTAVELALGVARGDFPHGFALLRPPGHHATINRPMGFCLLNNVAVAAGALLDRYPTHRIAIVDWDVHHGNGTQDIFYDNPAVLYISLHQWPHFPGSGQVTQTGNGAGTGCTINIPLPAGCGQTQYMSAFHQIVIPALCQFEPNHILVSAGFDAHRHDPLSSMNLTAPVFGEMTALIRLAATRLCDGRLSLFLEGGYNLSAIQNSVFQVLQALQRPINKRPTIAPTDAPEIQPLLDKIRQKSFLV